ncbi:hypothetical protein WICPIJ_008393 [Wickerhamomyces pijperi]|uniref:Lysine--tRNA ligase n=1 Tax=Wickerhamomyces pijperi TaxID=599730 RepID=A0A9P8TIP2_WICPI|nr:hypothetical protein WICPIJ_008393 [Wickerhamomyces pijperi]
MRRVVHLAGRVSTRSIRVKPCRFYSSSLNFTNEETEFANRKAQIFERHESYYPTLQQLREVPPTRVPQFIEKFHDYQWDTDKLSLDEIYSLEGKISSIRKSGKGMMFIDIVQDFQKVQLVLSNKMMNLSRDQFTSTHDFFKKGDFVHAMGFPGTTKVGELSLKLTKSLQIAAPTLHPLPPKLTDPEKRHHNRVVDYLVNKRSQQIIILKSQVISSIRSFLNERQFLEVSTPIISNSTKGANATPFSTSSKHLKDNHTGELVDLQLRVAPELWLKKLIIGGFDKVYEIGSNFRNEGIDGTHNPEFTTCEFYQTFTDLHELMKMTEKLFQGILKDVSGNEVVKPQLDVLSNGFSQFQKLEFIPAIEQQTKFPLPEQLTVDSLTEYFHRIQLPLPKIKSVPHLLDTLSSTYLEPLCTSSPTFIYNQPSIMSPLAKSSMVKYPNGKTYDISRRFELFINGKEFVNAYEEENCPVDQLEKFKLQQMLKDQFKDDETIVPDYKFLQTMEWGMPPTGGWGLGIDRLCMLLAGESRIEEVLTFGTLPDVIKQ